MTTPQPTCWDEIHGAASGDESHRHRFIQRYQPLIRTYLSFRWRDSKYASELDDAIQEVYLECFKQSGALASVDPTRRGGFRPFLHAIIRHVAQRVEKRDTRRRQHLEELGHPEDVPCDDTSLTKLFDLAWAKSLIREAVELLEERARDQGGDSQMRTRLLRLRFREDLPIREISERWSEDRQVLYREMEKAKKEFQAALLDVVQRRHPDSPADARREYENLLALFA